MIRRCGPVHGHGRIGLRNGSATASFGHDSLRISCDLERAAPADDLGVRDADAAMRCIGRSARSIVVLADRCDGRSLVMAVRAFAMVRRLGDGLTIAGYCGHRPRVEKWVRALRLDDAVTFADDVAGAASPGATAAWRRHDLAIMVGGGCSPLARQASLHGVRVVVFGGGHATQSRWSALGQVRRSLPVPGGAVIALARVMLADATPEQGQPARAEVMAGSVQAHGDMVRLSLVS